MVASRQPSLPGASWKTLFQHVNDREETKIRVTMPGKIGQYWIVDPRIAFDHAHGLVFLDSPTFQRTFNLFEQGTVVLHKVGLLPM